MLLVLLCLRFIHQSRFSGREGFLQNDLSYVSKRRCFRREWEREREEFWSTSYLALDFQDYRSSHSLVDLIQPEGLLKVLTPQNKAPNLSFSLAPFFFSLLRWKQFLFHNVTLYWVDNLIEEERRVEDEQEGSREVDSCVRNGRPFWQLMELFYLDGDATTLESELILLPPLHL